jgi:hypothetical protein
MRGKKLPDAAGAMKSRCSNDCLKGFAEGIGAERN